MNRLRSLGVPVSALLLTAALFGSEGTANAGSTTHRIVVFNGECNRLNAYDARTGAKQTVIRSNDPACDGKPRGLDINAQICFKPGTRRFIAGEDTHQDRGRPQGWGWFRLFGNRIGRFSAKEIGRFVPTFQADQDNPENYGCGFLPDGRAFTSDVGAQFPGQPANGQLIIWFPPFNRFRIPYCKIDVGLPTAGGIYIDGKKRVYVAANRPGQTSDGDPRQGGIYRYSPPYPTSNTSSGGCGERDATGAPLATNINRELFIPSDEHVMTPSAITRARDGSGHLYVSSVFTGVIAEYTKDGSFVREILRPPPGDTAPPFSTGTPFGIGVDSRGRLYYADLGVGPGPPPGPEEDAGTVRRIRFVGGEPQAPVKMDDQLNFPDGIGILEFNVKTAAARR